MSASKSRSCTEKKEPEIAVSCPKFYNINSFTIAVLRSLQSSATRYFVICENDLKGSNQTVLTEAMSEENMAQMAMIQSSKWNTHNIMTN